MNRRENKLEDPRNFSDAEKAKLGGAALSRDAGRLGALPRGGGYWFSNWFKISIIPRRRRTRGYTGYVGGIGGRQGRETRRGTGRENERETRGGRTRGWMVESPPVSDGFELGKVQTAQKRDDPSAPASLSFRLAAPLRDSPCAFTLSPLSLPPISAGAQFAVSPRSLSPSGLPSALSPFSTSQRTFPPSFDGSGNTRATTTT